MLTILESIFFGPFTANFGEFYGTDINVQSSSRRRHRTKNHTTDYHECSIMNQTLSICNNVVVRNEALPFLIGHPSPPT